MHHNIKQLTFQLSHQMRRIVIVAHTCSPRTVTCVHNSSAVGWGRGACPPELESSLFLEVLSTEDTSDKV